MTTYHIREIKESPLKQGTDEQIAYSLTTTPWGSDPSSPSVAIYDESGTDLSLTNLSGSASVSGDVVTTPKVLGLTAGVRYRLEIKFTSGGNIYEAYAYIKGES